MYHEDNPVTMNALTMKLTIAFSVHIMVLYFYFRTIPFDKPIHFGSDSLNTVRIICTLLLHMASYSNIANARTMLSFLIRNPFKFSNGFLFPSIICIFKILVTIVAELGSMFNLMYLKDEVSTIKFFSALLVVATFDANLIGIFQGISQADIDAKPLEYVPA